MNNNSVNQLELTAAVHFTETYFPDISVSHLKSFTFDGPSSSAEFKQVQHLDNYGMDPAPPLDLDAVQSQLRAACHPNIKVLR